MGTLYSLTSALALANLRTDLSDLASARWSDAQLNRAIDKAVERISDVYPLIKQTQLQTVTHVKRYAFPTGAGSIDLIEWPLEQWPRKFVNVEEYKTPLVLDPTAAVLPVQSQLAGALTAATYSWAYTFLVPGSGETLPSPLGTLAAAAGKAVTLSGWPQPPEGVVQLNLYRTIAGGAQLKLLASLQGPPADIAMSFVDAAADASLGPNAPTVNTTQGNDAYYLLLPPEMTPPNSTSWINVSATYKHQLDASGTTIPERYWDAIYLGGSAYAIDSYVQITNDNFEFADGMLRDKIDDTKSMAAWQQQGNTAVQRFTQRLAQLKSEWNAHRSGTMQWGDIALRSERI